MGRLPVVWRKPANRVIGFCRMRAVAHGISDVGLQREHNEDSFAVLTDHALAIVADGMGGHRAGDVASRLATEAIGEFFKKTANEDATWPFHFDPNLTDEENKLLTSIRLANRQIYEHSTRSQDLRGMGTTVVGALYSKRNVPVGCAICGRTSPTGKVTVVPSFAFSWY